MQKKEVKLAQKWFKGEFDKHKNILNGSFIEAKQSDTDSMARSKFKEHQLSSALLVGGKNIVTVARIPDEGISRKMADYAICSDYLFLLFYQSGWCLLPGEMVAKHYKENSSLSFKDACKNAIIKNH